MKTNVQTFCREFSQELDPFSSRLGEALGSLSGQSDLSRLGGTLLNLREVQQRLKTLQDKIGGQQAFLLIFGPLKSGKSTLMNAVSGAYVSEVSSLPAYPALVYVKNGEEVRFEATSYSGQKRQFRDNLEMTDAVHEDHEHLAARILEIERSGEAFDPRQHYPEAIRRIDVELPAPDLAESGTVLVDTPGLYSRMKFGYDQMTRDFRDTAACAIFVVKTDNLFFEKVFEEFEELLGCFSRIFLVSNIDTSKQDLKPDGTLEASLESRDPGKIIDAFRSLSMSATLREAIDDGRLNIYSIDLLKAASRRLRERAGTEDSQAAGSYASEAGDGFERFLEDLTSYLNSSDYLNDFMFDSLRVARDLGREALELVASRAAEELRQSTGRVREGLEKDRARLAAVEQLQQSNLNEAFDHLLREKDRLNEHSADHTRRLGDILEQEVEAWMKYDGTWNELVEGRLNSVLQEETGSDAEALEEQVRSLVDNPQGGARFSKAQQDSLRLLGLPVDEIARKELHRLGQTSGSNGLRLQIDREEIPFKRTLGDYLLLRSRKQSREMLFGRTGNEPIPPSLKHKRLSGAGEARLKEIVRRFVDEKLPALQGSYFGQLVDDYTDNFTQALRQRLTEMKGSLQRAVAEAEGKLAEGERASGLMDEIRGAAERFNSAIDELRERHGVEQNGPGQVQEAAIPQEGEVSWGNGDAEEISYDLDEKDESEGNGGFLGEQLWEEGRDSRQ